MADAAGVIMPHRARSTDLSVASARVGRAGDPSYEEECMKIVVTTPTGHVGRHVTAALLRAGVRPTLLVRDAARLDSTVRERSETVEVDLCDADAVAGATGGADALYWVNPSLPDDDPMVAHERLARSAAHAITVNRIPRVVFQSSVGAEARGGMGEIDGLALTEQVLDETGASVLHLRCGYFFTNLLMDLDSLRAGALVTTFALDEPMAWVDPRDIGEVVAGRLLSSWSGRVTQGVHGPEDLTFTQVAAILSEATGREIVAQRIGDDDLASRLRQVGMTDAQVEAIVGMARGLRGGFAGEDPRDVTTTTPSGLAGWAHATLRPLL
jgi:uncharacterized protein YbjT (DUF2867 family)